MVDYEILISTGETCVRDDSPNGATSSPVRTDGEGEDKDEVEAPNRETVPDRFTHITASEWKRIQLFAATAADDRDPDLLVPENEDPVGTATHSGATNPVTAERCRRIRRRMRDAVTVREVVGEYPQLHRSEIFRHAYGDCGHAHGTPATASPQIRRDECHAMRGAFSEGYYVSEIADEWHRAENTVTRHVFGRCSHDCDARAASPSQVSEGQADRLVRTVRENEQVGVEEVATAMRLRPEVVATILALADE